MKQQKPYVTYQKPERWTHKGYTALMYTSYNEYRNWRIRALIRPDGTEVTENILIKANIGPSRKKAQEYLRIKIDFDLLPQDQKDEKMAEWEQQAQYLW